MNNLKSEVHFKIMVEYIILIGVSEIIIREKFDVHGVFVLLS